MNETEIIRIRYWAAARAAAGVAEESLPVSGPLTLVEVVRRVLARHESPRLAEVIGVCSVLVGDQPMKSRRPEDVVVHPGTQVEFLPPFAGG